MRRREEIRSELSELDETLGVFQGYPPEPDTGAALMMHDLEQRRGELLTELEQVEAGELVFVLDGPHTPDHTAEVDQLTRWLRPLQDAVSSIAQVIRGRPTAAGAIEGAVVDLSRLRLAGTFPSSFGLALVGPALPEAEILQLPLEEEEDGWPLFQQAVARVLDVLEAAEDPDVYEQAIVDQVSGLGQRASSHLTSFAAAMAGWEAPVEVLFRPATKPQRRLRVEVATASRLQGVLTSITESEIVEPIRGRLVEASLPRRTFGIETAEEEIIRGRVDPDVAHRIEEYFGHDVDGTLVATHTRSTITGKEAVTYVLKTFAGPLDE